jgi:transposase
MQSEASIAVSEWALLLKELPNLADGAPPRNRSGHIGTRWFVGRPSEVEGPRAYATSGDEYKGILLTQRGVFTVEFKRGVVQQLLKGEKTLAEVSRELDIQPSVVRQWNPDDSIQSAAEVHYWRSRRSTKGTRIVVVLRISLVAILV